MPDFKRGRWAESTRHCYDVAWREYSGWCAQRSLVPVPAEPQTVADYLLWCQERGLAVQSMSQRLAAIVAAHDLEDCVLKVRGSVIRDAWSEIRRTGAAATPKEAIISDALKEIITSDIPLLQRTVLLVGFASAMRRSELCDLNMEDLEFSKEAVVITIRRSKTDKFGKGEVVALWRTGTPFCPVAALETYISYRNLNHEPRGALLINRFGARLKPPSVAQVVKTWGAKIGLDPKKLGAHSLRRGCITTMNDAGIDVKSGMALSRHKTVSIYMGYVQTKTAVDNPAIRKLGL